MKISLYLLIICICVALRSNAQDNQLAHQTNYIKVHFLYGSKPLPQYKDSERKWFGGVLGGHVGIEGDSGRILNFRHQGSFHVFANKNNRHSLYEEHSFKGFYSIFGGSADSTKKVIVTIPVTAEQKQLFDSLSASYLKETPYDYALMGMRCGAATYEILGQLGIMPEYSYRKTYMKIFYPQRLRRRLLEKAEKNNWIIERFDGSTRRKWEKD
jgi:hypothetical protein